MSTGSMTIFKKNLANIVPGVTGFFAGATQAYNTWKKISDRRWKYAPTEVREQKEVWETQCWKKHICQRNNMWIDKDLDSEVTTKEIAQLMSYKQDAWRMAHIATQPFFFGGFAVPFWFFWFANDLYIPSSFNTNNEQLAAWRHSHDLQRYKYVPAMLTDCKWHFDFHHPYLNDAAGHIWDDLFDKNDVRRDPKAINKLAKFYEGPSADKVNFGFFKVRRKQIRAIARAMSIPTFPLWMKINAQRRVADYWELAWNEDWMVLKNGLVAKMDDSELQDYAWRRYLAPYDKNLTRDQLLERVGDYHELLGEDFIKTGYTPNIFVFISYCMGYYNEPAFLDADISDLEKDDFAHAAALGKDAFLQRLEFENGPLRDQVEAQSFKKVEERRKKLLELEQGN